MLTTAAAVKLRSMTLTIVTQGQQPKPAYEKVALPRKGATALMGGLVAARRTSPAVHELTLVASHVAAGQNYELLKQCAADTAVQIRKLREAAQVFETDSDAASNPSTLLQNVDVITLHEDHDKRFTELDEALELIATL